MGTAPGPAASLGLPNRRRNRLQEADPPLADAKLTAQPRRPSMRSWGSIWMDRHRSRSIGRLPSARANRRPATASQRIPW